MEKDGSMMVMRVKDVCQLPHCREIADLNNKACNKMIEERYGLFAGRPRPSAIVIISSSTDAAIAGD